MAVREAKTPAEIEACFPVIEQLRPNLEAQEFVEQVQRQQEEGYRLVYVEADERPVSVAGFRVLEMLSRGRFLYVDDLVTRDEQRDYGYGTKLWDWLVDEARRRSCSSIDLDSGFGRKRAHRFYLDRGMEIVSLHFQSELDGNEGG